MSRKIAASGDAINAEPSKQAVVSAVSVIPPPQRQKKDPVSPRLARRLFSPSLYIPRGIGYFVSHMAEQIPGVPARFLGPRSPHQLKATYVLRRLPLEGGVEGRDQGLRQPEGEDELGARHEELEAKLC